MSDTARELPGEHIPVIVGYGRAGRELHHHCLRGITGGDGPRVLAVDPRRPDRLPAHTRWFPTLDEALAEVDPARAVAHVTTPAAAHEALVRRLADRGLRRIVVEKPLADSVAGARRIAAVARTGVQVLPVGVWPSSTVTERVRACVADGGIGTPVALHMEQSKPRFRRALMDSHTSALQVELPHQVLLALHLLGPAVGLEEAELWGMPRPTGDPLPGMGGGRLTLRHASGATSTLVSDLTSPVRVRTLTLTGTIGRIVAHYPVSDADDVGQLHLPRRAGRVLVHDAPLTQFLAAAYRWFADEGPPPPGSLDDHLQTVELLASAARRTGSAPATEGTGPPQVEAATEGTGPASTDEVMTPC
ncbi:Gfo/Idh/MocA family protein [Streptomyces sp. NPDC059063]|uniref:Gfo/Idh/MocA family protein n=1 Tax=unclassified Streptomyces TaxID=2593676 RepID=UPI0036952A2D